VTFHTLNLHFSSAFHTRKNAHARLQSLSDHCVLTFSEMSGLQMFRLHFLVLSGIDGHFQRGRPFLGRGGGVRQRPVAGCAPQTRALVLIGRFRLVCQVRERTTLNKNTAARRNRLHANSNQIKSNLFASTSIENNAKCKTNNNSNITDIQLNVPAGLKGSDTALT